MLLVGYEYDPPAWGLIKYEIGAMVALSNDIFIYVQMSGSKSIGGNGLKRIVGPCTMVSTAGTKRALYAHEDTTWTTIHANPDEERDIEKLEDFIIAKTYDGLLTESNIIDKIGDDL